MTIQRDDALKFLETILPMVTLNIENDGFLTPVAFLLVRVSPETGKRLEKPVMSICPLPWKNRAEKLYMQDQLRDVARRLDAELVLLVTEAWYAEGLTPQQQQEAEAHIEEHGSLAGFPNIRERVVARLEYGTGAEFWEAEIERVDKRVRLAPFENTERNQPHAILHFGVDNPHLTN